MGRWAQNTRRGGGPPRASAVVTAIYVESISTALVIFDRPVDTTFGSVGADARFTINGHPVTLVTFLNSTAIFVETTFALAAAQPWAITGQPDWIHTQIRETSGTLLAPPAEITRHDRLNATTVEFQTANAHAWLTNPGNALYLAASPATSIIDVNPFIFRIVIAGTVNGGDYWTITRASGWASPIVQPDAGIVT